MKRLENSFVDPSLLPPAINLGLWTDLHLIETVQGHVIEAANWLQGENLDALVHCGDANAPGDWPRYADRIHVPQSAGGLGFHPDVVDLPVVGNHDSEQPINAPYGEISPDPYATIKGEYPGLFQGRSYYHYDLENGDTSVRVICVNNNTDCLHPDGRPNYHNVNPPGDYGLNPDYSGWTDPDSDQLEWLEYVTASHHDWKILCAHRPLWSNFDGPGRPMHREGRASLRQAINNGLDFCLFGDQHVGCLAGRFYPDHFDTAKLVDARSNGTYALTLAGGYAPRVHDDTLLPEGSVLWSSSDVQDRINLMQAAKLQFQGENARLWIWQMVRGEPGEVVHDQWLIRNKGLAS